MFHHYLYDAHLEDHVVKQEIKHYFIGPENCIVVVKILIFIKKGKAINDHRSHCHEEEE